MDSSFNPLVLFNGLVPRFPRNFKTGKRLQNLQLRLCVKSAEEFQQPVERRTGTSSSNFERVVATFRVVESPGIVRQGAIVVVPHGNRIERDVEPVRFKDGSCERTGSRCSYIATLLATSPSAVEY